jgi:hypothetical protein
MLAFFDIRHVSMIDQQILGTWCRVVFDFGQLTLPAGFTPCPKRI